MPSRWSMPCAPARCPAPRWSRRPSPAPGRSTPRSTAWLTRTSTRRWLAPTYGSAVWRAISTGCRPTSRTTSTSRACRPCRALTRGIRGRADHGEFARFFLATGLIPLGKTQMSEFGFSASAEHPRLGAVRNPWNTDYTAGASSSGSGAFVAAGVVPIAHANDGGGSIRIPAACNGLVGPQTLPRPAAAGQDVAPDADPHRRQRRADPLGARHRRFLPRGRAHLA